MLGVDRKACQISAGTDASGDRATAVRLNRVCCIRTELLEIMRGRDRYRLGVTATTKGVGCRWAVSGMAAVAVSGEAM